MNEAAIRAHLAAALVAGPDDPLAALWARCASGTAMLLALERTGDRRLVARAAVACLREVAAYAPDAADAAIALVAAFAGGADVTAAECDLVRAALELPPGARGETALAAMAIGAALEVLDPDDAAPSVAAIGDVAADALVDAGRCATPADARARLADAIRRTTNPF